MSETIKSQRAEGFAPLPVRAFRVEHKGWLDVTGIVRTHSAPRARYLTWHSANDVGYKVKFADLRVTLAKEYDACETLKVDQCYAVDYAESLSANDQDEGLRRERGPQPK